MPQTLGRVLADPRFYLVNLTEMPPSPSAGSLFIRDWKAYQVLRGAVVGTQPTLCSPAAVWSTGGPESCQGQGNCFHLFKARKYLSHGLIRKTGFKWKLSSYTVKLFLTCDGNQVQFMRHESHCHASQSQHIIFTGLFLLLTAPLLWPVLFCCFFLPLAFKSHFHRFQKRLGFQTPFHKCFMLFLKQR